LNGHFAFHFIAPVRLDLWSLAFDAWPLLNVHSEVVSPNKQLRSLRCGAVSLPEHGFLVWYFLDLIIIIIIIIIETGRPNTDPVSRRETTRLGRHCDHLIGRVCH